MPKQSIQLLAVMIFFSHSISAFVVYEDTKIWNQKAITLYFLDGTAQQKSEVKRFAKLWQRYTGIKFNYTNTKPGIFNFEKYYKITFMGDSNVSTRGAVNGTIRFGNLADNIIFRKTTILHEFGHMLGLGHEHQRVDRPVSLDSKELITACIANQQQPRQWCKKNLNNKNNSEVFIESEYDSKSIMHYGLNHITGKNTQLLGTLPETRSNSLSYTDKYYIAMLYNQNISDRTLEKMHKQDVWKQQKFETQANKLREQTISNLTTASCKTLKYNSESKDGKFCAEGFMIIAKDDVSFPDAELKTCYTSYTNIKQKMNEHEYCQLNRVQLIKKRKMWSNQFAQHGNCKRLETKQKNRQEYFCAEGFSFVTLQNDMVGKTTQCFSSQESTYHAMLEHPVCNMDRYAFRLYKHQTKRSDTKQMKTRFCQVVTKKYKQINCPVGYKYTVIKLIDKNRPINSKCFSSKYQAINAMNKTQECTLNNLL
ncbi:hypothetical protein MNBD_GAMMA01-1630 [hydrothermal vent metagenome]|uniref:Peptidase metallopeptidase domain-containing protein n=1 Tax=hydrothermal vent metagenome TaxID=652676 RepID=A0A3B0VLW7_9ZZZZ